MGPKGNDGLSHSFPTSPARDIADIQEQEQRLERSTTREVDTVNLKATLQLKD